MMQLFKYLFIASCVSFLVTLILILNGFAETAGPFLILSLLLLALGMRKTKKWKGFSFTVLIFAAVSLSMYYPQSLVQIGDFQLKNSLFHYFK
jgi:BASS family bile acid:Na+ symporter